MIFFIQSLSKAQIADFNIKNSVCISEDLSLENISTDGKKYVWDFCHQGLLNDNFYGEIFTASEVNNSEGITIVYDNGNWYAFILGQNSNNIVRLDFGESLDNIPSLVNLGNINNLLENPREIKFINESGTWYGLIANNNSIIRLDFGNSLNSIPIANNIGNYGAWGAIRGLDIIESNGSKIVYFTSYTYSLIEIINFGNSIANSPNPATDYLSVTNSAFNKLFGINIIEDNGKWYGLLTSYLNNQIFHLDFGSNPFSVPIITLLKSVSFPTGCHVIKDGLNFFGLVATRSNGLYRINFGESMLISGPVNLETIETNGQLSEILGTSIVRNTPEYDFFTIHLSNLKINRIKFLDNCSFLTENYSTDFEPEGISYNLSGNQVIELSVFNDSGNLDFMQKVIEVKNQSAPATSLTTDNSCISSQNTFQASSTDDPSITSWNWDFGDGDTGSGQNVSHQYLSTGTYEVSLDIESNNGCANTTKKPITIYDPPSPDFDLPAGIICSNSETSFTNTTNLHDADTLVTWSWNFNNQGTSSDEHPNFVFPDGGSKNITLTAAIPGCSENISKPLNVTDGPDVDFTWSGTCEYELFGFINNTTGSDITGYEWDFGDGYVSSVTSPTHRFDNGGDYSISLTAQNLSGCVNSFEQIVPVRYEPEMDFNNELACSGSEIQFFDLSSVTSANITSRLWSSRPENSGAFQYQASGLEPFLSFDNPETYDVQLIVESNYGCVDTLVKSVNVIEGPTADFIIQNNCLGDSSHLLDNSTAPQGSSIVSADWLIDGNMYNGNEVAYKFSNLGEYEVQLYVRADNLCSNNIQKSVQINPAPSVNFNMSSECANTGITFSSDIISDFSPVAEYEWIIDGNVVSTEPTMIYSFPGVSDQTVQLHVVTEDLCSATHENTITLKPRPVAAFDAFPEYGAQPLTVSFSDQSLGAESIVWDFSTKNADSSIEAKPTYTYSDLGEDIVSLIATNEYNCVDTAQKTIRVVIPDYDATLSDVFFSVVDDAVQFNMTIRNSGNILISHPDITVRISDKLQLIQKVDEEILPGQEIDYEFSFQLLQLENNPIDYVCFSLSESIGDFNDINPEDNHQCLSLNEEFLLIDPYPNPAKSYVNVPLIMPSQGDAMIRLFGSKGEMVFERTFNNLDPGLNLIRFELEPYNAGLYFLSVQYDNTKITRKIVIR